MPIFYVNFIINKYLQYNKLCEYINSVFEYNQKINLVSRETNLLSLEKIVADCLIPFEFIEPPSGKILDIGSGAGLPAIPILLSFPELSATLFERTQKKARFLETTIKKFNLNAKVMANDFKSSVSYMPDKDFDFVFLRFIKLNNILLRGIFSLLKKGGSFIYYSQYGEKPFSLNGEMAIKSFQYYLDNRERIHTITIFYRQR
jgi:16S rRNA (guanine527-N7)-methyltransferase